MRFFFYCLCFFTITSAVFAQETTVQGTILDAHTNKGIPYAVITIQRLQKSYSANEEGKFVIKNLPNGSYHLDIRAIGYRSDHIDITLPVSAVITITLSPLPIEAPAVVVTDRASSSSKLTELMEHDHILHGNELQRELGQTLAATLRNEAGLAVRSMGPAPARPVIRGLSGNRVQINEDGVPAADLSATSPDHAVAIDPAMMEQIEIIRGPRTLLYSPSGMGGVVNAIRDDIPRILLHDALFSVAGGYESVLQGGSALASAEIPIGSFAFKTMGGLRSTQNISAPTGILSNTDITTSHLSFGGGYIDEDADAGASFAQFTTQYGIPGGFIGAHPKGVRIEMLKRTVNTRTAFHIHGDFADDIRVNLSRTFYHHNEKESNGAVGAEFFVTTYAGNFDIIQHSNPLFDNGTIGAYFSLKYYSYGGFVFTPANTVLEYAPYVFEEWHWGKTEFQTALRFNYLSISPDVEKDTRIGRIERKDFASLSASISILHPLSDNIALGGTFTRSNRPPTAEELFSLGPHLAAYSFETGNPDLPNELGYGSELFIHYKDTSTTVSATGFLMNYSSFITPRNTGDTNYATFLPIFSTSTLAARIWGVETKITQRLGYGLSTEITGSFTVGDNMDEQRPLPMIPPLKVLVELQYTKENWNAGIRVETAASQLRTDTFEEITNGYTICGAYIQTRFSVGTFINAVTVTADNLFNTIYRNHLSRIKSIFPEPGTNIRLHWRTYF